MTHIFINPDNEYPRHIGDIYLDAPEFDGDLDNLPTGWKPVTLTEPPLVTGNQTYFEVQPVLVDGNYLQTWDTRELTAEEIEFNSSPPRGLWEY